MEARNPETYVYYFLFALLLFGASVWAIAPFLPVEESVCLRISLIGGAFMFLSVFMFAVLGREVKENGKATSNKAKPE